MLLYQHSRDAIDLLQPSCNGESDGTASDHCMREICFLLWCTGEETRVAS